MFFLKLGILLVQSVFLLFQTALRILDFSILLVHVFFVVGLELQELLLGLKYLLLFDVLGFQFSFFNNFIPASLQNNPPCSHIDGKGENSAPESGKNIIDKHNYIFLIQLFQKKRSSHVGKRPSSKKSVSLIDRNLIKIRFEVR